MEAIAFASATNEWEPLTKTCRRVIATMIYARW